MAAAQISLVGAAQISLVAAAQISFVAAAQIYLFPCYYAHCPHRGSSRCIRDRRKTSLT